MTRRDSATIRYLRNDKADKNDLKKSLDAASGDARDARIPAPAKPKPAAKALKLDEVLERA